MISSFNQTSASTRFVCVGLTALMLSSCGLIGRRSVNQPIDDLPIPATAAPVPQPTFSANTQSQTLSPERVNVLNGLLRQGPIGRYTEGTPYTIGNKRYVPSENLSYVEQGLASWYGPGLAGNKTTNGERFNPNAHTAAHRTLPFSSIVRVTNLANGRSTIVRINDRGPFLANHIIDLSQKVAQDLGMVTSQGSQVRVELMEAETRAVAKVTGSQIGGFSNSFTGQQSTFAATSPVSQPINLASTAPSVPQPILPTVSSSSVTVAPIAAPVPAPVPALANIPAPVTSTNTLPLPPLPAATPVLPTVQAPTRPAVTQTANLSSPANQGAGYYVQAGSYSSRENAEQVRNKLTPVGNVVIFPVMVAGAQRFRVRVGPYKSRQAAQAKLGTVIVSGGPDAIVVKEG